MLYLQRIIVTLTLLLSFQFAATMGFAETPPDESPAIQQAGPGPGEAGLIFLRDGIPVSTMRQQSELPGIEGTDASAITTESLARGIVQALVNGPDVREAAGGMQHFLPEGSALGDVTFPAPNSLWLYLDLPANFMRTEFGEGYFQYMGRHFIESLNGLGLQEINFFFKDPATGEYIPGDKLIEPDPPEMAPIERHEPGSPPPVDERSIDITPRSLPTQNGFVNGALTGKRVVLNASHGWYDNNYALNRWAVQRTLTWQVLEDFASAHFVHQYVIPMMQNAGAIVRPVREPDTQPNSVVMDNAMGAPRYQENGTGWIFSGLKGYTHKDVYVGKTDNPFEAGSTSRLIRGAPIGAPTHSAVFTPTIPVTGYYNVYITYTAGTDRTSNAHWQVKHSGGTTDFRVNQKITGGTWFLLGNFYFEKDAPASQAQVVALNDSGDTDYLSVDAVRMGGGMSNVNRGAHGLSNKPRWSEEATYYLHYNGLLNSGFFRNSNTKPEDDNDEAYGWANRPYHARWEQNRDVLGTNLTYIAWHTNASTWKCTGGVEIEGGGRGTLVIRDNDTNASAATKDFTVKVRDGMVASVRGSYDSTWPLRSPGSDGILASNQYGESLQSRMGNVAGFLFEGVFHDNKKDSSAYKDGKFRYAAARGIVNGLIQYYGGTVFPPEPVINFRVKNVGNNQVRLEWNRGAVGNSSNRIGSAATNFRVFKSTNGHGFDNGVDVGNSLSYTMTLTPGEVVFLRVSATNTAGISMPSETLASRVGTGENPSILIVNGFQRDDQYLPPLRYLQNIGGCGTAAINYYRDLDPRKYQSLNYTIQHARAVAAKGGYSIDSCSRNAINSAQYNLANYNIVLWIGGQQAEVDTLDNVDDTAFRPNEQIALTNYLTGGGRLMISGSELGWDFGRPQASANNRLFFSNFLKAGFVNNDANTYNVVGTTGIFSGIGSINFDNGSGTAYDVSQPDILTPAGGATACLSYSGGLAGTAAIQYAGTFGTGTATGRLVYMGFPFEAITSEANRNTVMSRVLDFFIPAKVDEWSDF